MTLKSSIIDTPLILTADRTTPLKRHVVLYDGLCQFCIAGANKLVGLARPGTIVLINFQDPEVLKQFPGISLEACQRQMHLITPKGRVYRGFEAVVQVLATRPILKYLVYAYYLPGIRQLGDGLYRILAANRYRILGKASAYSECDGGNCPLHFDKTKKK